MSSLGKRRRWRRALTILEALLVVTLMGVLALIVVPRVSTQGTAAKVNSCGVHKGNIEVQAQMWFRNKGAWPKADLSDIGGDTTYLPDGLPTCPVDGSSYTFNTTTQRVNGHAH